MGHAIEIENLSKSFGNIKAVQDVSFQVEKGELFAFLGVNGAGKSTTISVICGQLKRDGGSVRVNGEDADRPSVRKEIGVVFQNSVLDKVLNVRDNLKSRAACYGITGKAFSDRLAVLTELFDLNPIMKRPVGKLSGGQRRRVDVARALISSPKILILDEPTTGLDPWTRKNLWDTIARLRKEENMTVLLTTHYMEEAAEADRVVIIDGGRVVAEGTPNELKNRYAGDFVTLYGVNERDVEKLSLPYETVREGTFRIAVPSLQAATKLIVENEGLFFDYEVVKGKMDDVFLSVTGKKPGEEGV